MTNENESRAKLAVQQILAGIRVQITDDISQYAEVIEPLNDALRDGGNWSARRVWLALQRTQHKWLRDLDNPEDLYPEIYSPDEYNEQDLLRLNQFEDSDFGQAEALIYLYKNRLRYVVGLNWIVWNGMRWQIDDRNAVLQFGMVGARVRLKSANYALEQTSSEDKDAIAQAMNRVRSASARRSVSAVKKSLEAAATMPYFVTDANELDSNPLRLGVRNGVLDLQSGELIAPAPDQLITKRTNINYYPDAPAPRWKQFLHEIFRGDEALIEYVQRCVGYSLTGDNREQCFWVLHGIGANGKSTFTDILRALTGEYGSAIEFKTFLAGGQSAVGDDIAPLRGVRLVVASENEQGKRLNESMVKQVTGGDEVRVRFLHGRYFSFQPVFKIWLVTNHKPVVVGTDRGIWRRVRMIPFEARFEDKQADKELSQKLQSELPGILAWAVQGCLNWQRFGLAMPEQVQQATEDYRSEMDTMGQFLAEMTVDSAQSRVTCKGLYSSYKEWTLESNLYTLSQPAFSRAMVERGYKKLKSGGLGWYWEGLALVN